MRPSLEPAPTIDARSTKAAEREHSKSVTKIGSHRGSAAIAMTAWLFNLPVTEGLHAVRCQKLRA
jgi:hypothetical protein